VASSAARRLAARERERAREEQGRRLAWGFLYTLFAFKIATVLVIWYAASSTRMHDLPFIIATTWYWLLIPVVGIAGRMVYRWRLIQMRRQRHRLKGAEWMVERTQDPGDSTTLTIEELLRQHDSGRR
jgi:hypothetical protein